jgi:hypothetical protein
VLDAEHVVLVHLIHLTVEHNSCLQNKSEHERKVCSAPVVTASLLTLAVCALNVLAADAFADSS